VVPPRLIDLRSKPNNILHEVNDLRLYCTGSDLRIRSLPFGVTDCVILIPSAPLALGGNTLGQVGERLKPTDCKSVPPCEVRRFESFPVHHFDCRQAVVAQLVEHFLGKEEVTGSIPVNGSNL
jgi:hypothetical protein